ncbi:MAG: zf-HC2 domain-containing protein [Actinobacteria bacterium]|nr:MAG: zf-HC2 domain-containing protein [Actinomycetota bacterium]TMM26734.1 MAG: zf-HC2 domain-containing protein [Actinomycetota bacterium]
MAAAAHCLQAEPAISRDLDGRLSWRERRRLRAHLRDCAGCASFARFQREQRTALRRMRLIAVPNSLQVFRPNGF